MSAHYLSNTLHVWLSFFVPKAVTELQDWIGLFFMALKHASIWIRPVMRFFRGAEAAKILPVTHSSFDVRPTLLDEDQREIMSIIDQVVGKQILVLPNVIASNFLTIKNASSSLSEAQLLSRAKVKFLICDRRTTKPLGAIFYGLRGQPDPAGHLLFQICQQTKFPLLIVGSLTKAHADHQPPAELIRQWLEKSFRKQSAERRIDSAHSVES